MDEEIEVFAPLYLLTSTEECWKCHKPQNVIALGTHQIVDDSQIFGDSADTTDLLLLSNIESMPPEVLQYIVQRYPRFMERYSDTAEASYYANTCECGANFGDFYLFLEPGGAFFPDTDEAAKEIKYHKMPFSGTLRFACSYSHGIGDLILAHATKEEA